jgi:two-component sensor histidine kinase
MALRLLKHNLGYDLLQRKDPKAIVYLQEALAICIQQKEIGEQVVGMLSLSQAYIAFGKFQKGYELLSRAKAIKDTLPANFSNDYTGSQLFEGHWVQYYQAIGDWKQAFEHLSKLSDLERNRLWADREGIMSRLSVEYETEKKEAQLKSQQKELALNTENLKNQRRFLATVLVLLVGAIGASVAFYRLYRQNQRISRRNAELVREQNHRVKNNLQVVSSLLNLQSNRLADEAAKQAVGESQSRIETMAILHRRLYDSDQLVGVYLNEFIEDVTERVLQSFGYYDIYPEYTIPSLAIEADHALRIGLIINELVTNACKYAFPDNDAPAFRIACIQQGSYLTLTVSDNGSGFVYSPKSVKTFGMRLIEMQVEQLEGTYEFQSDGNGTVFWMKFNV